MEYLKKHKKITQVEYAKAKDFIIYQLKLEENKGLKFDKAMSNLKNLLEERFIQNNFIGKQTFYFSIARNALAYHHQNYDSSKVDSILNTLENEVLKDFNSTMETFKIYKIDPENFENMTFEKFFPELLKLVVYKRCYSRLDNSIPNLMQAFKLFFDTNNYDEFTDSLLQDEDEKITTERIQKIFKKLGRVLPVESTKKSNDFDIKDLNRFSIKYKEQISKFNDDEKALLLSLCVRPQYKLPATEKIKLILISSSINNDYTIFEEKANNNSLYNKINTGFSKNLNKNIKRNITESTLEKIKLFQLTQSTLLLKSIRDKL